MLVAEMTLYESLQIGLFLLVAVIGGGLGLLLYRMRAMQADIARNDARLDAHGERLATCEAKQGSIEEIRKDLREGRDIHKTLLTETAKMDGHMEALGTQLTLIQQHLMGTSS